MSIWAWSLVSTQKDSLCAPASGGLAYTKDPHLCLSSTSGGSVDSDPGKDVSLAAGIAAAAAERSVEYSFSSAEWLSEE